MKPAHRLSARLTRWTSLCVCFALILASLTLITPISSGSSFMPQGHNGQPNNGNKVSPAPPVTGAPEASLPSLEEPRQRRNVEPKARQPIPSTLRSRRKPVESRQGRKVGDPLPPKKRASTNEFGDGSERVTVAGADRRGYVGDRAFTSSAHYSLATGGDL